MGDKGDILTNNSSLAVEEILDKLSPVQDISSKKMFGGYGLFHLGKMFGIVNSKGDRYLKVNDSNKEDFLDKGSHQHSKMPYFSIPFEVENDIDTLLKWAKNQ
jgi:DNA transformation protein